MVSNNKIVSKRIIITIIVAALAGLMILFFWTNYTSKDVTKVVLGEQLFSLEIARSPEQHYRGLSGKEYLCNNCGLLFLFNEPARKTFVMRDMLFPLDIIFIDKDVIVDIYHNLAPEGAITKNSYSSSRPVDKVLEINGGRANQLKLKIGDQIILK